MDFAIFIALFFVDVCLVEVIKSKCDDLSLFINDLTEIFVKTDSPSISRLDVMKQVG